MQPDLFGVSPHKPTQSYRIPIYKIALVREAALTVCQPPQLCSSAQAVSVIRTYLAETDREHLLVLTVDTRNRLIGINTVSVGSLNSSLGHPREIFKAAILQNAAAVILAHNHPSGDSAPSAEDQRLQLLLDEAGHALGVRVVDHLVLAEGGLHSAVEGASPPPDPVSLVPREGVG